MPAATHNGSQTRLYHIWQSVKYRAKTRPTYQKRGIDPAWLAWENFRDWALTNGYADHLTIDRIDNKKGYFPENCRFVTAIQNARNRDDTLYITAFGETKPTQDWAEDSRCVVSYRTLVKRYHESHWEPERALTQPLNKNMSRPKANPTNSADIGCLMP